MSIPFALPDLITTEIDWPMPPSLNHAWRKNKYGGMYLHAKHRAFRLACGKIIMAMRPKAKIIAEPFEAHIKLNQEMARNTSDADNRAKAVLDAAQRCGLISNDKHCRRLTIEWVDAANAPEGCRLTLRELTT